MNMRCHSTACASENAVPDPSITAAAVAAAAVAAVDDAESDVGTEIDAATGSRAFDARCAAACASECEPLADVKGLL